jgi:regulator of cell morphogenesis and NO signaling
MDGSFDLTRAGAPEWALDDLADHIVDRHHRYVQGAIPALRQALAVALDGWGATHAPLAAARAIFEELADELASHMAKEEHILFPAIREMARARRRGQDTAGAAFATLLHPIRVMEGEHARARQLLIDLRRDTQSYRAPAGADDSGRECYRQLARFDEDLETHIHLENDVLFPRTLELERQTV